VLHPTQVTTLERFILDQEREHPEATGELTNLLYDVALAAKLIAASIRRAGLVNVLGAVGQTNVQGEEQQKLDVFANDTMKNALNHTGRICAMASEEDEELILIPDGVPPGKYVVLFDPLDGSSNIDVNAAVGTIFSIYRRVTAEGAGTLADVLQAGHHQVAAGYVIYGSSVMMVYSAGHGVHGFTLDPTIGEFLLSNPRMQMPATATYVEGDPGRGARLQGRRSRPGAAEELPLHRLAGGRLPPQPRQGRDLPLSRRSQEPEGQAAPALRVRPDGVPGGAGGGRRDRRPAAHPRPRARGAP